MISIEQLSDILNKQLSKEFLEAALELWDDGDMPIDPEHPDMETVLEGVAESINDILETLPLEDDYV